MFKYAKLINGETKQCDVGLGTNESFYQLFAMTLLDVEQAFDGNWYLVGYVPAAPKPTYAELRAVAYPPDTDQLDMLYHDIDHGLLGEDAKTSSFYLARKTVKETYPK